MRSCPDLPHGAAGTDWCGLGTVAVHTGLDPLAAREHLVPEWSCLRGSLGSELSAVGLVGVDQGRSS